MGRLILNEGLYTFISRCIRCGQCAYGDKDVNFEVLCPLYKNFNFFSHSAGGLVQIARAIFEEKIKLNQNITDIVYKCTTCGVCENACGVINSINHRISPMKIIQLIKEKIIEGKVKIPEQLENIVKNILKYKNFFEYKEEDKKVFIKKVKNPDLLYFVGCTASSREIGIAQSFSKLLKETKESFIISEEEWCCGMPLYFLGFTEFFKDYVLHNIEFIKNIGVKKVVFTCAGCYYMFKIIYPLFFKKDLPFEVQHSTEFLENKIKKGDFKLEVKQANKITYHDPCHLGRGVGVYDAPRFILKKAFGEKFTEMKRNRQNSFCCGSGGGVVKKSYPDYSLKNAEDRIIEANKLNCDILITSCPACKINLNNAISRLRLKLKVYDIVEVITN